MHEADINDRRPSFADTEEVAFELGVSTRTITRLANEGKIPGAIKVGRQWRFNRNVLFPTHNAPCINKIE